MKVIFILNTGEYSGAENVIITICRQLMSKGFECIYASKMGSIQKYLMEENIEFYQINKLTPLAIKKLVSICNPDIIHANDFTASIICSMAGVKIPVISHLHNNPPWIRTFNFKTILYSITLKKYKKVLLVSEAIEHEFFLKKYLRKKSKVIGNPLDSEYIRGKVGVCSVEKSDIVFCGRLTEQKNPLLALSVIKRLVKKYPDIICRFLGHGDLLEECKRYIISNNLTKNVILEGFVPNRLDYMKNSKIMIMPSKWEGFGLVAFEALCLGIPVITSGAGGITKIVDNQCGKICCSEKEYYEEINELLSNMDYYLVKKTNAYKKADVISNMEDYIKDLKYIYES